MLSVAYPGFCVGTFQGLWETAIPSGIYRFSVPADSDVLVFCWPICLEHFNGQKYDDLKYKNIVKHCGIMIYL